MDSVQIILKTNCGDYVGESGTINTQRDSAKRFNSEDEALAYAKENRIHTDFTSEPA